jgi:hypothetical protein
MITYDRLKLIIPADQALACKAIQVSLQQVKGISTTTLESLSGAFGAIQTTDNLSNINALTSAVPSSTSNFFANTYATGSGPDGQLYLTDVIGLAVGGTDNIDSVAMSNIYTTMNTMQTAGKFSGLITLYTTMTNVNLGLYGNPVTGPIANVPGSGNLVYANATVCYANLLFSQAIANTNSIISANPTEVANLNAGSNQLASDVTLDLQALGDAGIDIFNLEPGGRSSVTSFVQSLHDYGKDITEYGPAWYLQQVTDTSVLAGQSVVAVMREGVNIDVISNAGLKQDTAVPDTPKNPIPPSTQLIPSTQNSSQAKANIVV